MTPIVLLIFVCYRYINEQLYTQTGSEAAKLFTDDQESFHCYHEGFQNQVEKWPTNPVDVIITQIKAGFVVGEVGLKIYFVCLLFLD